MARTIIMARFLTFSRTFPAYHPKAGQPTRFIEKIYAGLADINPDFKIPNDANAFWDWHEYYNCTAPKFHTIREGHRWKAGDYFSPRVWGNDINPKTGRSGPYQSKMITIAPDIKIERVWGIIIYKSDEFEGAETVANIEGIKMPIHPNHYTAQQLAKNDGLSVEDMLNWFNKPLSGQIICWNKEIEY